MKQNDFFNRTKMQFINVFKSIKSKNTSFFIVALCICLISTAVIWKVTTDNDGKNLGEEDIKVPNPITATTDDPYDDYVQKTMEEYKKALENQKKQAIKTEKSKLESFIKPISGTISREFNITELVYFEAIEEWKTHQGIDIQADGSLIVCSSYDGVVEKLSTNSTMGTEIVINHGDDILTLYSCLSSSSVKIGDKVSKGQKIGTLGITENIESSDIPHLHYEIIVKGKNYDPSSYYTN